jgi:hypothetical protein
VHAGDSSLVCSDRSGVLVARTGVPLADVYLEFLGGRCRPNTVRAAAYDLKVFFTAVARPPDQVRPAGSGTCGSWCGRPCWGWLQRDGQLTESTVNEVASDGRTYSSATMRHGTRA